MKTIFIVLWFTGLEMSIDAPRLYGYTSLQQCEDDLVLVIKEYKANEGLCYIAGDIHARFRKI